MEKPDAQAIRQTIADANRGDKEALAQVQKWSKNWTRETIASLSSLAHVIRTTAVSKAVDDNLGAAQCMMRREAELNAEMLIGPNASPLEKLLAEQVSINWLTLRIAELLQAINHGNGQSVWQSRVDSAHRRFLSALKTLAQVQRLQIPNLVQINIAEQQVNVAPSESLE